MAGRSFRLSGEPIDPPELKRLLVQKDAGGFVSFEGWVRGNNEGREVESLEYEGYRELAEKEGGTIIAEALRNFAIIGAECTHRVGHLRIGDLAVWVGVTAEHRQDSFAACQFIIDQVKLHVPIWKKEHYIDGNSGWIGIGNVSDRPVSETAEGGR